MCRVNALVGLVFVYVGSIIIAILPLSELVLMSSNLGFKSSQTLCDMLLSSMDTASPEENQGFNTGLSSLDSVLPAFRGGDLIIIAGRPSSGKSSLARQIIIEGSEHRDMVLGFTFTNRAVDVASQFISQMSGVPFLTIFNNSLSHEDWPAFTKALGLFSKRPILINDEQISIDDLETLSTQLCEDSHSSFEGATGISAIFIDDLQSLQICSGGQEKLGFRLKVLANRLNVPIIVTCGVSSKVDARSHKVPKLHDLDALNDVSDYADIVLSLNREDHQRRLENHELNMTITVLKNRYGHLATVPCHFDINSARFYSENPVKP